MFSFYITSMEIYSILNKLGRVTRSVSPPIQKKKNNPKLSRYMVSISAFASRKLPISFLKIFNTMSETLKTTLNIPNLKLGNSDFFQTWLGNSNETVPGSLRSYLWSELRCFFVIFCQKSIFSNYKRNLRVGCN